MTDIGEFVLAAKLSCESCEFAAENVSDAMVHALTGHTVSGETPDGDTVTISTEPFDED
jgi:hypothetical protein